MARAVKQFYGRHGRGFQEVALDDLGQWWSRTVTGPQGRYGACKTVVGWHLLDPSEIRAADWVHHPIRMTKIKLADDELAFHKQAGSIQGQYGPLQPLPKPDARLPRTDEEKARLEEIKALRQAAGRGKSGGRQQSAWGRL